MWSGNRWTTSVTVAIQESPLLDVTEMVRPWRSAGRVRVSPWKRAPQTPPFTLAGIHPGRGTGWRGLYRSDRLLGSRGRGTELAIEGLVDEGTQPGADVEVARGKVRYTSQRYRSRPSEERLSAVRVFISSGTGWRMISLKNASPK